MAALSEAPRLEVVDLLQVNPLQMRRLFAEEIAVWRRKFRWDFRASVDLLTRYIQMQSLYGYALRAGSHVIGYTYFVSESRKGLIGNFFVSEEFDHPAHEQLLLNTAVSGLMRTAGIRRIESQLMLLRAQNAALPHPRYLSRHDRIFMEIDSSSGTSLPAAVPEIDVTFVLWAERYSEELAHLVSSAYRGHIDSEINDQYRNIPGARHFLTNIIRYPGCGTFAPACSVLAIDKRSGRVCGVCLASKISEDAGHITQLCVLPAIRGAHLGYELIRRSLVELRAAGCATASLTVTCTNVNAIRLYESLGFSAKSIFPALVWDGF